MRGPALTLYLVTGPALSITLSFGGGGADALKPPPFFSPSFSSSSYAYGPRTPSSLEAALEEGGSVGFPSFVGGGGRKFFPLPQSLSIIFRVTSPITSANDGVADRPEKSSISSHFGCLFSPFFFFFLLGLASFSTFLSSNFFSFPDPRNVFLFASAIVVIIFLRGEAQPARPSRSFRSIGPPVCPL